MSVEVLPSGHYRARVMIKGKLYGKVFDKKEDALLWEKMVKARRGIGFSDNDIDFKDKKSVFYHISKQINSKNKGKNMRVLEELAEIDEMSGNAFEEYCISLFELSGLLKYARYSVTRKSGDYGADIIIETAYGEKIGVQCKRLKTSPVRIEAIQEIVGSQKHYKTKHSIVMTNSKFTENAINLAFTNRVLLIDRDVLIKMIGMKIDNLKEIEEKKQWKNMVDILS